MTIRYLDLEDGNDALDGLTFANRKKTIANVTVGLAGGDEVRQIASPVNALGACQWTDNSRNITIPAGLVKLVDSAESGFTAAANVTVSTNIERKFGATSAQFTIAGAFTTGKVAHKTLAAPLDLSAFQYLSLWIYGHNVALGSLDLRLCSDATGDVPVATMVLDDGATAGVANRWNIVAKDLGAALPSNVNSIAIYANTDPGIPSFRINDIVASKGRDAPDHLSLLSLVGKQTAGEPEWYPLANISDTNVAIGADVFSYEGGNIPRPYRGITESVSTYAIRPTAISSNLTSRIVATAGTLAAPIKFTGGWDRAGMTVQTGASWVTGKHLYGSVIEASSTRSYWTVQKIGSAHIVGTSISAVNTGWDVQLEGVLACSGAPISDAGSADGRQSTNIKQIWGSSFAWTYPVMGKLTRVTIDRIHGGTNAGRAYLNQVGWHEDNEVAIGQIDNCVGYGFGSLAANERGKINGTKFLNNVLGDIMVNGGGATVVAHNCTLGSATPYTLTGTDPSTEIILSAQDGDPTAHMRIRRHSILTTDSTVRHTASGVSWKLTLRGVIHSAQDNPVTFPLADVAVKAGVPVTVNCWVRRDSIALGAGIMVRGNRLPGVPETTVPGAAGVNVWEQLTLTFTPTAAGVIQVLGYAHSALQTAWFDDLEITQ